MGGCAVWAIVAAMGVAADAGLMDYYEWGNHELANANNGIEQHSYDGHNNHGNYNAPADYSFEFSVNDPYTGDMKNQRESRQGDQVVGQYSLQEPDGTTRMVHYTADKYNGFRATVVSGGKITRHPAQEHQLKTQEK